jgi:protein-tyrosine-phosphatase
MNQARSPFAEAVIKLHFPSATVSSAGVEATSGTPYLPEVVAVARAWGLSIANGNSILIKDEEPISTDTFVICAEEYMCNFITTQGFTGPMECYENIVPDPSFMPLDPAGFRGRRLETELAKVAFANIWAVKKLSDPQKLQDITVVIPEHERHSQDAISYALEIAESSGALLIDADMRSPIVRELGNRKLKIGSFESASDHEEYELLSNIREHHEPLVALMAPEWNKRIQRIANNRPVVIMTAPQLIDSGPLPDSYLAATAGNLISIVR